MKERAAASSDGQRCPMAAAATTINR